MYDKFGVVNDNFELCYDKFGAKYDKFGAELRQFRAYMTNSVHIIFNDLIFSFLRLNMTNSVFSTIVNRQSIVFFY